MGIADQCSVLWIVYMVVFLDVAHDSNAALADWKEDMDQFIEEVMQCRNVPGLSIALVSEGNVLLTQGYGNSETDPLQPTDENTLFPIGSLTKSFTSAVIADVLSQQEANVTWDTPVVKILGPTFVLDGCFRTEETTLRDLLSHRVGLEEDEILTVMGLDMNKDNFVRRVGHLKEKHPFRSQFYYSNFMYTLASKVAEYLARDSYRELVKRRLFRPLGMTSSRLMDEFDSLTAVPNLAKGYGTSDKGEVFPYNIDTLSIVEVVDASGAIMSNAKDMATWMIFQLNGGKNSQGRVVVKEDFLSETQKPQVSLHDPKVMDRSKYPVEDMKNDYGMGWIEGAYRGFRRLSHTGNIASYFSNIFLFPSEDTGVFVALNGPMDERDAVAAMKTITWFVADNLLNEPPWMDSEGACKYPDPWVNATQPDSGANDPADAFPTVGDRSNSLDKYVGTYGHLAYGNLRVSFSESDIEDKHLRYTYGDYGSGRLYATNDEHTFKASIDGELWYYGDNLHFNDKFPGGVYMKFKDAAFGVMQSVNFPGIGNGNGPEFQRDLLASTTWTPISQQCDGVSAGSGVKGHHLLTLAIYLAFFLSNIFDDGHPL